ncbi:MAG: hypothetical protein WCW31_01675 [Patescibacteria group bacterium]
MPDSQLFMIPPPDRLAGRVFEAVRQAEAKTAKRRVIFFSLALTVVFLLLVLVVSDFLIQSKNSGFETYLSLLVSDWRVLQSNLPDYAATLLESFPAIQFAISLLLVTSILAIMRRLSREAKRLTLANKKLAN